MRQILRYVHRALAVAYLLVMGVPFALIPGNGTTSDAALTAWVVLVGAVFIGWMAGREGAGQ